MKLKALVIGYGSIGKRHAKLLSNFDLISHVSVLSSQKNLPYDTIKSIEEIKDIMPDYIVIASPTSQHYKHIKFLEENFIDKKILVEKPLFDLYHDYNIQKNKIYVGFHLRFHPIVKEIQNAIYGRNLWNVQIFCGSYLPEWRKDRDYRFTSSASKSSGGGVLLDLSHELDYIQWLLGPLKINHKVNTKVSDLEIDSDDLLLLSCQTKSAANVHISLNYFTRKSTRQILIDGQGISIHGNLVENQLLITKDGKEKKFSWKDLDRNDMYIAQHIAVLNGDLSNICSYKEGLNNLKFIEDIREIKND